MAFTGLTSDTICSVFYADYYAEKENLEKIEEEEDDDDDESAYHQHDGEQNDGELVQHPDEGYQGVHDSNGQGTFA